MRYAAFLLGINVGGNRKVPMADLKILFEKTLKFSEVKTLLNSGNVVFEAAKADASMIEKAVAKRFGFDVGVILRTLDELRALERGEPFKGIPVTKDTRLYVTFRGDATAKGTLKAPYVSPDKSFRILRIGKGEIVSVLTVGEKGGRTVDAMAVLGKEFGKKLTTRNWNTIEKILAP